MKFDIEKDNYRSYKGFNLTREDPFGFWTVRSFDNKDILGLGTFTSTRDAVNAIDGYLVGLEKKKKKG